jgi:hypothetical protein
VLTPTFSTCEPLKYRFGEFTVAPAASKAFVISTFE